MSRDSKGPRKTFSKGGSSDFNKRKSFSSSSDKPKRSYKSEGSEKPAFKKRDDGAGEKRSYTKREGGFDKPYKKREDGKYESSGPRKSYGDKSFGDKESRPYKKREDGKYESSGPRKSYGDGEKRSYGSKSYGDGEKRPFTKKEDGKYESSGPRKSYGDGEKRSYGSKSYGDGEKRPFTKTADGKYESSGPRKNYGDGEKRSYGSKSYGDGEKRPFTKKEDGKYESSGPRKSYGDKPQGDGEKRSYKKREDGKYESSGPRKSYGDKPYGDGEKRSYTKKEDGKYGSKPYTPKLSKAERVVEKTKKAGPKKTSDQQNVSPDAVRLNRYIANSGVCSRREADVLIATGVVSVNGKVITEMGYKVNPEDKVSYGGVPIKNENKKYLLLNKPKDYITTMDDPQERRTVMELIRNACRERLYPVGRLDRNTTGVLLFTNDGDMTAKLTHPKFDVRKVYHVTLNKKMTSEDYRMLNEGLELSDGFIKPDAAEFVGTGKGELGIEIHSGRNRIVRRMFEHLGYEVMKLDRVSFASLTKKDLPRGKFRFLTEKEISFLKMLG